MKEEKRKEYIVIGRVEDRRAPAATASLLQLFLLPKIVPQTSAMLQRQLEVASVT